METVKILIKNSTETNTREGDLYLSSGVIKIKNEFFHINELQRREFLIEEFIAEPAKELDPPKTKKTSLKKPVI